jgi:hypothetical protein
LTRTASLRRLKCVVTRISRCCCPSPSMRRVALGVAVLMRGAATAQDRNFDEAVRDFREAVDKTSGIVSGEKAQALHQKLQQAMHKQREWQQRRDHRCCAAAPDFTRPRILVVSISRSDAGLGRRAVLELPVNLQQLSQEKQCTWVKKQHKALARKWHPDKARGNKQRAARKMREVSEAKEALVEQLRC